MDLTKEQILEMTETIARACGIHCERIKYHVYRVEMLSGEEESFSIFTPYESWDDAFIAADAMDVGPIAIYPFISIDGMMSRARLGCGGQVEGTHLHKRTAFFLALHEAAKVKLEGYQNEYGN